MIAILMMSAKLATPVILKTNVFKNSLITLVFLWEHLK